MQALASQFVQHVQAGEPGADDHCIETSVVDRRHVASRSVACDRLYRKAYSMYGNSRMECTDYP
jgi:hypothetical protein